MDDNNIENSFYQNNVGTETFRMKYIAQLTFTYEHFPKPTPTPLKEPFWVISRSWKQFFRICRVRYTGIAVFVLGVYQTPYGRHT